MGKLLKFQIERDNYQPVYLVIKLRLKYQAIWLVVPAQCFTIDQWNTNYQSEHVVIKLSVKYQASDWLL